MTEKAPHSDSYRSPLLSAGWACAALSSFLTFRWSDDFFFEHAERLQALPSFAPLIGAVLLGVVALTIGFRAVSAKSMLAGLLLCFGSVLLPVFGAVWPLATRVVDAIQQR